jgi:hypothetical protein
LQALLPNFNASVSGDAADVARRRSQARDKPLGKWIGHETNDRGVGGYLTYNTYWAVTYREDNVRPEAQGFGRQLTVDVPATATGGVPVYCEVCTLNVTKPTKLYKKRVPIWIYSGFTHFFDSRAGMNDRKLVLATRLFRKSMI